MDAPRRVRHADTAITAAVFLLLALLLVSCATRPPPAPARASATCDAYATVLPVHVSRRDTEPTKKAVFGANAMHESLCGK